MELLVAGIKSRNVEGTKIDLIIHILTTFRKKKVISGKIEHIVSILSFLWSENNGQLYINTSNHSVIFSKSIPTLIDWNTFKVINRSCFDVMFDFPYCVIITTN